MATFSTSIEAILYQARWGLNFYLQLRMELQASN